MRNAERALDSLKIMQGGKFGCLISEDFLPVESDLLLDKLFERSLCRGTFQQPERMIQSIQEAEVPNLLEPGTS